MEIASPEGKSFAVQSVLTTALLVGLMCIPGLEAPEARTKQDRELTAAARPTHNLIGAEVAAQQW